MNSDFTRRISERLFPSLAGAAFLLCYAGVIVALVNVWSTYPLYSYGFAVPFIAGYLYKERRRTTAAILRKPDYAWGASLIAIGLAMLLVGHAGTMQTIKQTSLLITFAGLILVVYGRETLKIYRFAFAYLFLMVPIWDFALNQLQDPSRLLSARIASELLQAVGIPVLRQGSNLMLASVTLSVMPQCSGVNQLIVLIAMVLPAAYLWLPTYRRRAALFAFAIAVGYCSNGFRIALVGWLAVHGLGDGDIAKSYTHLVEGLVVSAVGYVAILAFLSLLARTSGNASEGSLLPTVKPAAPPHAVSRRTAIDAIILLVLLAAPLPVAAGSRDVGSASNLGSLPATIGEWSAVIGNEVRGIREDLVGAYPTEAGVRRFAGVDEEILRSYRRPSSSVVHLYVGYYKRQAEGRELTSDAAHVLEAAHSRLSIATESGPLAVSEVVRDEGATRRGVIFCYLVDGRVVPNSLGVKAYTILNALVHGRTDGAVVMVTWAGPSSEDAHGQAIDFVKTILPAVRARLPR